MKHSKIYDRFNGELQVITTYAKANQKRLDLTAATITALEQDWALWTASYQKYLDPNEQTTPLILRVNKLYHDINSYLRVFKQSVKHNADVDLTEADYKNLFIHQDKRRQGHVHVPNVAPHVELLETHHLTNRFEVVNPNPPEQTHRALPLGAEHIGRKLAVVPTGRPAPQPADYHNLTQIGRTIFELNFEPTQKGQLGYLIAWYVNRRGEVGPESEPTSFVIA